MPFKIVHSDITKMHVDVIVNAANNYLEPGGGVCGAIFNAAGRSELIKECRSKVYCKTGEAVITSGFNLPAVHIIHTVGPVWQGGDNGERKLLYNCYKNSLKLAKNNNLQSIAFPLISSGIYGYPKDQSLKVAISAINDFLKQNDMLVYLAVFAKTADMLSEKLFKSISQYIDDFYVKENEPRIRNSRLTVCEPLCKYGSEHFMDQQNSASLTSEARMRTLDDLINNADKSFSQMLLQLIDEKGKTDADIYKKACVDRKLFSKIRNNTNYKPSKRTAIALAVALELSLNETKDLLFKAGYALSHSSKFDIIIGYFIEHRIYDMFEINLVLFKFNQHLLGV